MDRRAVLELALRRLLDELDSTTGKDVAPLARELRAVAAELEQMRPVEVSSVDDLTAKRAARRAAATG